MNFDSDKPMIVLGVHGRLSHRTTDPAIADSNLWLHQRWISESRPCPGYDEGAMLRVEMRFDDECHNGHNTFAITGEVYKTSPRGRNKYGSKIEIAGGCLHDDIAKVYPEFAGLIRWHLTSSDGPMHYIANTLYHAGDRDAWGARKGEPRQWETVIQFGSNPIKHRYRGKFVEFLQAAAPHPGRAAYDFEVLPLYHDEKPGEHQFSPKYTLGGFGEEWHEGPFETEQDALDFLCAMQTCDPKFVKIATTWGEGKQRDFAAARATAIWPDASDEILSAEPAILKAALEQRHAALMQAFRADIEATGFVWSPELMPATSGV